MHEVESVRRKRRVLPKDSIDPREIHRTRPGDHLEGLREDMSIDDDLGDDVDLSRGVELAIDQ